ncbi:hypothetical protein UZ36_06630 [Candidatus Nitromaritima sp. SCGC AAA799-C22]|nr:hypothetical protein UZ36_06630 [Candidatus Nitromaritima sp. SCGC AAA799-C22]
MLNGMFNALSGLRTSAQRLQNSANNLANVQTSGFKKSTVNTSEVQSGGSQVTSTTRVNVQGGIQPTGNPTDLAIDGNGFFQVALPNGGTGFTRSGRFTTDAGGNLVTADGNALVPPINIPGNSTGVSVESSGQVSAQVGGNAQGLGQIQLANFNNPSGLTPQGNNIFIESNASGAPVVGNPGVGGNGTILSGSLELSNVDIAEEMVNQITAKAAFTANARVIRAADEMLGTILDIKS